MDLIFVYAALLFAAMMMAMMFRAPAWAALRVHARRRKQR